MIAGVLMAAVFGVAAQVELRAGEPAPPGEIAAVDAGGVRLAPNSSDPARAGIVIGWDRIREVRGPMADEAAPFMVVADHAWRARTRLERGDAIGAERLFEDLFNTRYRGERGATARVVAEGLLRCRLRRGAHVAAVEPWLALLDIEVEPGTLHAGWSVEAGLAPVMDAATGLIPAIPPIWAGGAAATSMSGPGFERSGTPGLSGQKGARIAELYLTAARFEAGQDVVAPSLNEADPGVLLVAQIVAARVGDAGLRRSARLALQERLTPARSTDVSPWVEAWCRAAIGRSYLREDSAEDRRLGVIELLHLPARFSRVHQYLAGTSLAEASVALEAMGDKAGAASLRAELFGRYPGHPVLEWDPIRSAAPRPTPTPPGIAPIGVPDPPT